MPNARVQSVLQPATQKLARYVGMATPGLHMTPSFLICGAQRCGTTSMYQAMRAHPAVMRPTARKGVHYFDTGFQHNLNWYLGHFPFKLQAAALRRKVGRNPMTFESSPYYLFHPLSADRIARTLPDVKIVILLRDPVERAYSAHAHELARGYETEPFERALELEDERLAGEEQKLIDQPNYISHAHQHQAYVHRGYYFYQVQRMITAVGSDRVHVVDSEDFFTNPEPVWNEVLDYLGLPHEAGREFRRHNARPRSAMPESLRRSLHDRYAETDEQLTQWWGRVPSWRR